MHGRPAYIQPRIAADYLALDDRESAIGAEIIANASGFGAFIRTASVSGINQTAVAGMLAILVIVFVVNRMVWAPLLNESAKRYAE